MMMNMTNCSLYPNESSCTKESMSGLDESGEVLAYTVCSIVFCLVVMLVGVSGNSFVIITFVSRWSRLKTCEIFMVGLAVADWLGTTSVPLNLVLELLKVDFTPIGDYGCAFVTWLNVTSVTVSAFSLVAIAIDRFIIVLWPLKAKVRQWKAAVISMGIWISAGPVGAVYFFGGRNRLHSNQGHIVCRTFWQSLTEDYIHTTATFVIQMVIPIVLMIALYTGITCELRTSKGLKLTEDCVRVNQIRNRRNRKAIRLFLTIVFLFYILVLPYNIFFLLYTFHEIRSTTTTFYVFTVLNLVHMLNSCVNPLIYARLHTSFRRTALRMFFSCCIKKFTQYEWNTMSFSRRMSLRSRYMGRSNSTSASPGESPQIRRNSKRPSGRGANSFLSPVLSTRVSVVSPSPKVFPRCPSQSEPQSPITPNSSLQVGYVRYEETVHFYSAPNPCYKQSPDADDKTDAVSGPPTPNTSKYVRFANHSVTFEAKANVQSLLHSGHANGRAKVLHEESHGEEDATESDMGVLSGASEWGTSSSKLKPPASILKRGTSEEEELVRFDSSYQGR